MSLNIKEIIFKLKTRQLGTISEKLINILYDGRVSNNLEFDSFQGQEHVEVKSSVVRKCTNKNINKNLSDKRYLKEFLESFDEEKIIKFNERKNCKWDCNIQQIKKYLFDYLFFILYFEDMFIIFKMHSQEIDKDNIGYSNKQHRGNKEEGQFHINTINIDEIIEKYAVNKLSYNEIQELINE